MLQRTIDQKQMNITIVLGDKIPSIKYGGTQRVMWYLGKELDKRGHKVTFIAGKGSYCPFAKVIELDPAGNLNAQIPADTDLVHFNIPVPDGESLYFGAPIFGTPYGALPELVPPEVGFLTTHRQEMAEHIQSAQYSPKVCHEYARDLFNSSVMAEAYLKKYETVLNGEPLNKEVPHVIDIARRLPWD